MENPKEWSSPGQYLSSNTIRIYTNDKPIQTQPGEKYFIRVDNVIQVIQGNNSEKVKSEMNISLKAMLDYYQKHHFKLNLNKTHICVFYLRNR